MEKIFIIIIGFIAGIVSSIVSVEIIEADHTSEEVNVRLINEKYICKFRKLLSIKNKIINYEVLSLGIINTLLYALIYNRYGYSLECIKFFILITILMIISIIDIKSKYVYNITTNCGLIIGIIFLIIEYIFLGRSPINQIFGLILGFCIMGGLCIITKGFGEGDIGVLGVCGIFIGYKGVILTAILSIVIAGILMFILLIVKKINGKEEIAFVPYLSIGSILYILYSEKIIEIYGILM